MKSHLRVDFLKQVGEPGVSPLQLKVDYRTYWGRLREQFVNMRWNRDFIRPRSQLGYVGFFFSIINLVRHFAWASANMRWNHDTVVLLG